MDAWPFARIGMSGDPSKTYALKLGLGSLMVRTRHWSQTQHSALEVGMNAKFSLPNNDIENGSCFGHFHAAQPFSQKQNATPNSHSPHVIGVIETQTRFVSSHGF